MKATSVSFRVDDANIPVLEALASMGRNRSEFINEAIKMHGPFLVKKIEREFEISQKFKSSFQGYTDDLEKNRKAQEEDDKKAKAKVMQLGKK